MTVIPDAQQMINKIALTIYGLNLTMENFAIVM
jgi:hypothetical protein